MHLRPLCVHIRKKAPADFVFKDLEDKDVGDFQFFVEREFSDWEYTFGTGTKKDTFSTTFKVRINPDFVKENSSVLSGVTFTDISESNFNLTFKGFYHVQIRLTVVKKLFFFVLSKTQLHRAWQYL